MQEAVPVGAGAMAAILGLDEAGVTRPARKPAQGEVVSPANLNGAGQIVIAGTAAAVARAGERAKALGAKRAIPLHGERAVSLRADEAGRSAPDARAARGADRAIRASRSSPTSMPSRSAPRRRRSTP